MRADHLELLVEEFSMEAFLTELLPRMIGDDTTFKIHSYQGKTDLLGKLGSRLKAYAKWLPAEARIIVVVDRDGDVCEDLKKRLEAAASDAGFRSRSAKGEQSWQVVNRIAIEELEAWYFGDWAAVRNVYPKVPESIPTRAEYRAPDMIVGGTWEALERILQKAGYFRGGLRKAEIARNLGRVIDPAANASPSFAYFRDAVLEAIRC